MAHAPRRIVLGFIAGAVSVLTFHQGMIGVLHAVHAVSWTPFPTAPAGPLHIPLVFDLAFWGGSWGAVFGLLAPRLRGPDWVLGLGLGIVAAATYWFVVSPLKGGPIAENGDIRGIVLSLVVNGFWGVGTAVILSAMTASRRLARA